MTRRVPVVDCVPAVDQADPPQPQTVAALCWWSSVPYYRPNRTPKFRAVRGRGTSRLAVAAHRA